MSDDLLKSLMIIEELQKWVSLVDLTSQTPRTLNCTMHVSAESRESSDLNSQGRLAQVLANSEFICTTVWERSIVYYPTRTRFRMKMSFGVCVQCLFRYTMLMAFLGIAYTINPDYAEEVRDILGYLYCIALVVKLD